MTLHVSSLWIRHITISKTLIYVWGKLNVTCTFLLLFITSHIWKLSVKMAVSCCNLQNNFSVLMAFEYVRVYFIHIINSFHIWINVWTSHIEIILIICIKSYDPLYHYTHCDTRIDVKMYPWNIKFRQKNNILKTKIQQMILLFYKQNLNKKYHV